MMVVPIWWVLIRDAALLLVGLGGILYFHSTGDPSTLLVVADLVLVGLIPLGHLTLRWPGVHYETVVTPEPLARRSSGTGSASSPDG